MNFSFLQGIKQQPLELSGGFNRNSLDFSRPLSVFSGGYNQQMSPLSSATQEPVDGYMQFNAPPPPAMESGQQMAPSLLAPAPEQRGATTSPVNEGKAGDIRLKAEQMAAQGSPMLSQVQQMGGRYQRQYKGLLG